MFAVYMWLKLSVMHCSTSSSCQLTPIPDIVKLLVMSVNSSKQCYSKH